MTDSCNPTASTSGHLRTLRAFGLRRSGNHAVLSWLIDHLPGPILHLNNVKLFDSDPFSTFGRAYVKGDALWRYCSNPRRIISHYLRQALLRPTRPLLPRIDKHTRLDCLRQFARRSTVICSYEDCDLSDRNLQCCDEVYSQHFGAQRPRTDLLILRDPFNTFASLIKSGMLTDENRLAMIRQYKMYCQAANDGFAFPNASQPLVVINFNLWHMDLDYRVQCAATLGFVTSGTRYTFVPAHGGGSSFTGTSRYAQSDSDGVLSRWRIMVDNDAFRRVFEDHELLDVSRPLFGPPPVEILDCRRR